MTALATDDTGFVVEEVSATPEAPQPTKRKRRTKAEMEAADMGGESSPAEAADTEPKRRKSKGGTKDKAALWSQQIMGFYGIAAAVTGVPFLAVSEQEAKQLANAAIAVAEEYDFEVAGKYAAVGGLIVAMAMVNVPRALMFRQHLQMVRTTRPVANPVEVQPYAHNAPLSDAGSHPFETMPKVDPGRPIH